MKSWGTMVTSPALAGSMPTFRMAGTARLVAEAPGADHLAPQSSGLVIWRPSRDLEGAGPLEDLPMTWTSAPIAGGQHLGTQEMPKLGVAARDHGGRTMSTRREDRDVDPSACIPLVERGVVARELRWGTTGVQPDLRQRAAALDEHAAATIATAAPRAASLRVNPILSPPSRPHGGRAVHRSAGPTAGSPTRIRRPGRAGPARSLQSSDAAASGEPRSWPVAPGGPTAPAGHPPAARPPAGPSARTRASLLRPRRDRPLDDDDRHVEPHADRAGEDESGPRALEVEVRGVRDDVLARAHLRRPEVLPMIAPIVARVWRPRAMKMKGIAAGCALAEDLGRARRVGLHELQAAGDALVSPGRC